MLSEKEQERLSFASQLRLEADGSEVALRAELRASYYSLLHAADVLFGDVRHENVVERICSVDAEFEKTIKESKQLRMSADYDPHLLQRSYSEDLELFRITVRKHIADCAAVFQRLILEASKK